VFYIGERVNVAMILQLKQLFELEGHAVDIDMAVPVSELQNTPLYETFAAPVEIKGKVSNRVGVVTLDYTVKALLHQTCDRCLKAFDREYAYDFSHTLARSLSSDGDEFEDYVICPDNTLDLNELAVSDLLLELPSKILCKEDCLGLCLRCGKNLNDGVCDCKED
jgi:uncharacterized protein